MRQTCGLKLLNNHYFRQKQETASAHYSRQDSLAFKLPAMLKKRNEQSTSKNKLGDFCGSVISCYLFSKI